MYILKKLLFGLHAHIVPYFLVQLVCRNIKTEDIQKTQVMIIYPAYMYASLCAYLHNIHNTHLCIILDIFVCVCIYAYRKSEMRLKLFQRKPHYMKRGLPSSSRSTHSLTPSLLLFQCGQQLPYIAPRRPWRARWTGGQQACQCREPGPGGLRCHGRQR